MVNLAFALVVIRRYGMVALATGKRARHAAIGRAKRSSWTGLPLHSGGRAGNYTVHTIILQLRRERQIMAFATYGM